MNPLSRILNHWRHIGLFALVLAVDQATKHWARLRFSLGNGEPNYADSLPVVGDWLHFRLVYNYGAAFGMKPQNVVPFLHPIVFYALFSLAAIGFLGLYYRRLGPTEPAARLGILMILAGAFGNLIDRISMHRVTDFIDAGIPGVVPRWPVFNIADSAVCIGIALLIIPPFFSRGSSATTPPDATPQTPQTGSPESTPHDA